LNYTLQLFKLFGFYLSATAHAFLVWGSLIYALTFVYIVMEFYSTPANFIKINN